MHCTNVRRLQQYLKPRFVHEIILNDEVEVALESLQGRDKLSDAFFVKRPGEGLGEPPKSVLGGKLRDYLFQDSFEQGEWAILAG